MSEEEIHMIQAVSPLDFNIQFVGGDKQKPCEWCDDGSGRCMYPYYGVAPHSHDLSHGTFIGSTRLLDKASWPANFSPDPGEDGCGVFTHCLKCGAS